MKPRVYALQLLEEDAQRLRALAARAGLDADQLVLEALLALGRALDLYSRAGLTVTIVGQELRLTAVAGEEAAGAA